MRRLSANLSTKRSLGVEPAADNNVEAVGPCCLDVNTRSAGFAKGRFQLLWWLIWAYFALFLLLLGLPVLANVLSGDQLGYGINFSEHGVALVIASTLLLPTIAGYVYVWRNRHPIRFNRETRSVTFHYKWGITYTEPWEKLTAYLYLQRVADPEAIRKHEGQVRLEFNRADGNSTQAVLMGTDTYGATDYERAAQLWEYIRVYMEEGPEALPSPEKEPRRGWGWGRWIKHHSPFPMFPSRSFWRLIIEPVAFPARVLLFFVNAPTDIIYSWIERSAASVPYPDELEKACRCTETVSERRERVSALLASYSEKIKENTQNLLEAERALLKAYADRFVGPSGALGEDERQVPEGWYWAKLTDLVEINPTYNVGSGKQAVAIATDALAEHGPLVNRERISFCTTPPSSIMFREGDTLLPFAQPWLDQGRGAYVDFMAAETDTDLGSPSPDIIVLRGSKLSPELTYCLSKDQRIRDRAKALLDGCDAREDAITQLGDFALPMPEPGVLEEFDTEIAQPAFAKIRELSTTNERLRRCRRRVMNNTGQSA